MFRYCAEFGFVFKARQWVHTDYILIVCAHCRNEENGFKANIDQSKQD
ncbi:MAG: hypothetical protein GY874_01245 [Desulfobacteraceae bacterium]|nr:hypothetical protein [Desulfobacteraceae bacterium]